MINNEAFHRAVYEACLEALKDFDFSETSFARKKYLTRKEAAEYLNISTSALDRYAIKDSIPFIQPEFSSLKLYHTKDLDEWVLANKR